MEPKKEISIFDTIDSLDNFQKAETTLRDLIRERRFSYRLAQDKTLYFAVGALDAIGDTITGLQSFLNNPQMDMGLRYISVYGALQSMYVQQDAVSELHKIIKNKELRYKEAFPEIHEVREIRDGAIGHPSRRYDDNRSHAIVRATLEPFIFEYGTFKSQSEPSICIKQVDLVKLILQNTDSLSYLLNDLIDHRNRENDKHRSQFSGIFLTDLFKGYDYLCQTLYRCIDESVNGAADLATIENMLSKFQENLKERSGHYKNEYFMRDLIPQLNYALEKLRVYFSEPNAHENDAIILHHFIKSYMDEIYKIAEEIDDEYRTLEVD